MEPKLYLVRIIEDIGPAWDTFAAVAADIEEATTKARTFFMVDGPYDEADPLELFPVDEVCGYKVTLSK